MYLLVVAACALGLHVLLVRTSVHRWLAYGLTLVVFAVAGALAGAPSLLEQALALVVLLVAFATGLAMRKMRDIVAAIDGLDGPPEALRPDAIELEAELVGLGFTPAPEGWHHVEPKGWDLLAVVRGHIAGLVVSGAAGPTLELDSFLDNGRVLLTCSSGRDPVRPHVVRQVFPGANASQLLGEHQLVIDLAEANGRTASAIDASSVDELMLKEEQAHGQAVLQRGTVGIFGSVWRETVGTHLDTGSVADRPESAAELLASTPVE